MSVALARRKDEKNKSELRVLTQQEENKVCMDCPMKAPQYAVLNYNTFVCETCSAEHRSLQHKVKGITMSQFTDDEMTGLRNGGNAKASKIWRGSWNRAIHPLPREGDETSIRDFIRLTYLEKRWYVDVSPSASANPPACPDTSTSTHAAPAPVHLFGGKKIHMPTSATRSSDETSAGSHHHTVDDHHSHQEHASNAMKSSTHDAKTVPPVVSFDMFSPGANEVAMVSECRGGMDEFFTAPPVQNIIQSSKPNTFIPDFGSAPPQATSANAISFGSDSAISGFGFNPNQPPAQNNMMGANNGFGFNPNQPSAQNNMMGANNGYGFNPNQPPAQNNMMNNFGQQPPPNETFTHSATPAPAAANNKPDPFASLF